MKAALNEFRADLHIHTALSPCADRAMTPPAIVAAALEKGLSMIAICDHNSSGNSLAVAQASRGRLTVLHGLEIATSEDVHVLGIFGDAKSAGDVGRQVSQKLPAMTKADSRHFGQQWLMDEHGKVLAKERTMLAGSSHFDLHKVVKLITNALGLIVASHADRSTFSVFSQLGFIPADVTFDALEVSPAGLRGRKAELELAKTNLPLVTSSDSHYLSEIGATYTVLRMEAPTFAELRLAVRGANGRAILGRYCA